MASLKQQLDAAGYDVSNFDETAVLKQLDEAGYDVSAFKAAGPVHPIPSDIENEPGVIPVTGLRQVGDYTKGAFSGATDLMYGNGPQQAATDFQKVTDEGEAETKLGKAGAAVGSLFTPENLAMSAVGGQLFEGFGPWVANIMKGWSESAARVAIGIIGKIAKGIGIDNLDTIAQFLLKPIKVGTKIFAPIIQATSSPKTMLDAAELVQKAAGEALGKINPVVDQALQKNMSAIDLKGILENLDELKLAVEKYAPKTGKVLVQKFEDAIDDFLQLVKNSAESENPTLFTDLRNLKTTLGTIINDFGSDAPGKVALQKIWGTISEGIDNAAKAADPVVSAAFNEANAVYNKITAVIGALEGKVLSSSAKSIFTDVPAIGMGILAGFTNPMAAIPTAIAAHTARNYGPQAIAKGLNVVAPYVAPLINAGVRSIPIVRTAISSALGQ